MLSPPTQVLPGKGKSSYSELVEGKSLSEQGLKDDDIIRIEAKVSH